MDNKIKREDCEECKDLHAGEVTEGHDHDVIEDAPTVDETVTVEAEPVEETVEEVVEEEVEETPVEEKVEEPEEDLSDYVSLDKAELQTLREEVNQLFQKGKGKFSFHGLNIRAK